MKKIFLKIGFLLLLCAFLPFVPSCGQERGALLTVQEIAVVFPLKYGVVYSDEFDEDDDYFFSEEMKRIILGENAGKYDYIVSVSGYFSRDRVSGEEIIVILLDDRSHRSEVASVLYRRAAKKQDIPTRVFCNGDFVYFICTDEPDEIVQYIKTKM